MARRARSPEAARPTWTAAFEETARRLVSRVAGHPKAYLALAGLLVVAALAVRVPVALETVAVTHGHPDANTYFNAAHAAYLKGRHVALYHGGSGWPLTLDLAFRAFGYSPGPWVPPGGPVPPEAAEAIRFAALVGAVLSAAAVATTLLLARELSLSRPLALAAAALVAFDPFLVTEAGSLMSEPGYTLFLTLAVLFALRARRSAGWLALSGLMMAGAHAYRVNGLVMAVAVALVAWAALRPVPRGKRAGAFVAYALAFVVALAPYFAWRADEWGSPLNYGTNTRLWADDLWDTDAPFWTTGERETMGDYFARHGLRDAWDRFHASLALQFQDFLGAALPPLVAALLVAALFLERRSPGVRLALLLALFTLVTFVWMYPVVRSTRYFSPLTPFVAIAASIGLAALARRARAPHLAGAAVLGLQLFLAAIPQLLRVPAGLSQLSAAGSRPGVLALGALAALLALALGGDLPGSRSAPRPDRKDEAAAPVVD